MKNLKLFLIGLGVLVLVGGYFLLKPKTQETIAPRNPEGVVNEELTSENYKDYSKGDYEDALAQEKVIVLYFTANWCPICREQEPINMQVFNELGGSDALALRIHILDNEETESSKALAEEFGVTYQHTYVFLNARGEVSSKYTGPLTAEEIKSRILAAKEG